MNLKPNVISQMTPTAIKLYDFAASRKLPTTIGTDDYARLCGIEISSPGWMQEVERVCRELVSASVVKGAYVHEGTIYLL